MRDLKNGLSYLLCLITICLSHAQHKGKYQYRWALFHPIAAIKVKKIYKEVYPIYQQIKKEKVLDTIENGGKLDAFRHGFFMACFAQKVKPTKIIKLGIAHEKDDALFFVKKKKAEYADIPDSVSIQMDLFNNQLGVIIGNQYKHLPVYQLKDTILRYILLQKFKTLK